MDDLYRTDLLILDNDGVLVDSEPLAIEVVIDLVAEYGHVFTFEEGVRRFLGRTIEATRRMVEAEIGRALPPTSRTATTPRCSLASGGTCSQSRAWSSCCTMSTGGGIPYCLASSGTRERIALALATVGLHDRLPCDRIFSAADVEHGKPAPDLLLLAATTLGAAPGRCVVVVEDSPAGVAAAGRRFLTGPVVGEGQRRRVTEGSSPNSSRYRWAKRDRCTKPHRVAISVTPTSSGSLASSSARTRLSLTLRTYAVGDSPSFS